MILNPTIRIHIQCDWDVVRRYAEQQGENLDQLLTDAGRHFRADTITPRAAIADEEIAALIEDDERAGQRGAR